MNFWAFAKVCILTSAFLICIGYDMINSCRVCSQVNLHFWMQCTYFCQCTVICSFVFFTYFSAYLYIMLLWSTVNAFRRACDSDVGHLKSSEACCGTTKTGKIFCTCVWLCYFYHFVVQIFLFFTYSYIYISSRYWFSD